MEVLYNDALKNSFLGQIYINHVLNPVAYDSDLGQITTPQMSAWVWFKSNHSTFSGFNGECYQIYKVWSSDNLFSSQFCIASNATVQIKGLLTVSGVSETATISNIEMELNSWSFLYFSVSNSEQKSTIFLETGRTSYQLHLMQFVVKISLRKTL